MEKLSAEERAVLQEQFFHMSQKTNEQDRYNRGLDPLTGEPLNGREPSI